MTGDKNPYPPMNAKIIAMLLVAGLFATGSYAADTSASSQSSSAASSQPSIASDADSAGAPRMFTVDQVIRSEYRYGSSYKTGGDPDSPAFVRSSRDADPFPVQAAARQVVFGVTPSPIIGGDPSGPTSYFPSITFQFDFGRNYHS